jgi:serine protease Do
MSPSRSRKAASLATLFGAVVFGMVLAGGLELTPESHAAPDAAAGAVAAAADPVPVAPSLAAGLPSFADLAERVVPAVVSIEAQTIERGAAGRRRGQQPNPFDFFFGPRGQPGQPGQPDAEREYRSDSGGSGFVVSADGYVVTNNHVIEGATRVRVRLNERLYDAEVKGVDPATDLALVKVDARDLTYLQLGDSDRLRVGDYVMAIGNPLLLDHTVTVGVVSAKGRSIGLSQDTSFENFIQTDAAINRGNSGGPLVNLRGEVIGIATAMNWGAENIGFAVPVNTLKSVLPQLRETGRVQRGYLGINIQNLDFDRAQAFGLDKPEGALVTRVVEGSPAATAGVEHGDVVLAVDGRPVRETRDLIDYVSSQGPGKTVALDLLRDGKRMTRQVKLTEREGTESAELEEGDRRGGGLDWLGLDYQNLTPAMRQSFGLPDSAAGVLVREVAPSSPLYDEGVGPGDVITEVNGREVANAEELETAVSAIRSGGFVRFYVRRFDPRNPDNAASFFAVVRVP